MNNILAVVLITFLVFILFALSLMFSKYKQSRKGNECANSQHDSPHRCGHCACDFDPH